MSGVVEAAYRPTNRDLAYVEVLLDLIDEGQAVTDGAAAKRLKGPSGKPLTRQAVAKMRTRPGFVEWVESHIRSGRTVRWAAIESRFESLAMRGSVKHAEFLATLQQRGGYAASKLPGAAGAFSGAAIANFTLNVGVPLTPAPDPSAPGGVPLPAGAVVSDVKKAG